MRAAGKLLGPLAVAGACLLGGCTMNSLGDVFQTRPTLDVGASSCSPMARRQPMAFIPATQARIAKVQSSYSLGARSAPAPRSAWKQIASGECY
jgi:hypothetical protein